ncbi:MAG: DUF5615 family PIN-like protein [Gemmatimonadota bacterium]
MKLRLDQNLSRRLVADLGDIFTGSTHVGLVGLDRADDAEIWRYAATNGFVLVSKDADFHQLSLVRGAPPKVVWVRLGNASTQAIASLLRRHASDLELFVTDAEAVFLALG